MYSGPLFEYCKKYRKQRVVSYKLSKVTGRNESGIKNKTLTYLGYIEPFCIEL